MDSIDVRDLPEPLARSIQMMVEMMRDQLRAGKPKPHRKLALPVKHGKVIGSLKREDLYADI